MQKIKNFFNAVLDFVDPYRAGPWAVKYNFFAVIIMGCAVYWIYQYLAANGMPRILAFLSFLSIGVHEAGHPIFRWISFGNEFWSYAGGTLMEIIVPVTAFFVLIRKNKPMQADICVGWLGYSFFSIGHYAASTSLPEVTLLNAGPGTISDWEYFHDYFGTLRYDVMIGNIFYGLCALFIVVAIYSFIKHLHQMGKVINHNLEL